MKHLLSYFLFASFLLFFLVSCEDSPSKDSSSEQETKISEEQTTSSPQNKPKQTIKAELSTEDALVLNDQVTVQIQYIDSVLNQLNELDSEDADSTLMLQKADSLLIYINEFRIEGFEKKLPTLNSSEFMKCTFGFLEAMQTKATLFKDYAGKNSIPDEEWEEEWVNEIHQIIEPTFMYFNESRESFINAQINFSTLHGIALTEV